MTQNIRVAVVAGFAFAAGFAASHVSVPAGATAMTPMPVMTPHYYPDLALLTPAPGATPPFTVKVASAPGATVTYFVGTVKAHTHPVSNEFQYVIAGTGTQQFGSCTVLFKPGTFLVIPHGYGHAGLKATPGTGPIRLLVVKTPPDTLPVGPPPPITCQH